MEAGQFRFMQEQQRHCVVADSTCLNFGVLHMAGRLHQ